MKRQCSVLFVLGFVWAAHAWAAPAGPAPQASETQVVPLAAPPLADPLPGERSETAALLLSLGATTLPAALALTHPRATYALGVQPGLVLLGSLILGPSVGHVYAGRPGRALLGIGVRVGALAGLAGAVALSWNSYSSGAEALGVVSLALGAGLWIWDIASAPGSARAHNRKLRERRLSLGAGPVGSTGAPGIVLTATF